MLSKCIIKINKQTSRLSVPYVLCQQKYISSLSKSIVKNIILQFTLLSVHCTVYLQACDSRISAVSEILRTQKIEKNVVLKI